MSNEKLSDLVRDTAEIISGLRGARALAQGEIRRIDKDIRKHFNDLVEATGLSPKAVKLALLQYELEEEERAKVVRDMGICLRALGMVQIDMFSEAELPELAVETQAGAEEPELPLDDGAGEARGDDAGDDTADDADDSPEEFADAADGGELDGGADDESLYRRAGVQQVYVN